MATNYEQHAADAQRARVLINRNFADPGCRDAHWARATAAVMIHYGASLDEAVAVALPKLEAA